MNITFNTNTELNPFNKNTDKAANQSQQAATEKLYDTYQKSQEEVIYPQYQKYKNWEVDKFSQPLGDEVYNEDFPWSLFAPYDGPSPLGVLNIKIHDDAHEWMSKYYQGKAAMDEVLNFMELCSNRVLDYWNTTNPDKLTSDFKKKIVETVYENFLSEGGLAAVYECQNRGYELYGNKDRPPAHCTYAYYSSEIYYDWKTMKRNLLEKANMLENDIGEGEVNDYAVQKSLGIRGDFHKLWNWSFCQNSYTGRIIDTSQEPPRNLVLFYRGMPNTSSGRVLIETDNGTYNLDVPFALELENQKMDMKSLLDIWKIREEDRYIKFLKNILFFTPVHGHTCQRQFV